MQWSHRVAGRAMRPPRVISASNEAAIGNISVQRWAPTLPSANGISVHDGHSKKHVNCSSPGGFSDEIRPAARIGAVV